MIDFEQFRVSKTNAINLSEFDTEQNGGLMDRELKKIRDGLWKEIAQYQQRLYAQSEQSLLIVLQAMDAAGKDSTIDKLTKNLSAIGTQVHSFKKPSKLELSHDFLWRVHDKVPAKGCVTIFNRSHYEDVLIVKVHGWASEEIINKRYEHINNFESLINDNKTKVVKFMLHITPEYQLGRFNARLENADKNWKFNPGDLDERTHWFDYMAAFQELLKRCSSEQSPWYVVPAQNRAFRDVMIASVVLKTLKEMNPQNPELDFKVSDFKGKLV